MILIEAQNLLNSLGEVRDASRQIESVAYSMVVFDVDIQPPYNAIVTAGEGPSSQGTSIKEKSLE